MAEQLDPQQMITSVPGVTVHAAEQPSSGVEQPLIDTVPGALPVPEAPQPSTEQVQPIIDTVPGVTTAAPTEQVEEVAPDAEPGSRENPVVVDTSHITEWGGYTKHRIDSSGRNPNFPVVGDPKALAMLDAAAKSMYPKPDDKK